MRFVFTLVLILYFDFSFSQKIDGFINPVIKGLSERLNVTQHTDGNYLINGHFSFYNEISCGSLIKVSSSGSLVSGFQKVFTDKEVEQVAVLPSGKILIRGQFKYLNGEEVAQVVLLNEDGSKDNSFNLDKEAIISSLVIQSSGKILVAISINPPYYNSIVKRLNTDGSVDESFVSTLPAFYVDKMIGGPDDNTYVLQQGKIYRLLPDGTKDDTFNSTIGTYPSNILALAVQPDSKIVASVYEVTSLDPYTTVNTLKKLNSDGTLDDTFSAETTDRISQILIRQSGKMIIAGELFSYASTPGNLFELNADGSFNRVILTVDLNLIFNLYEDADENIFITGPFKTVEEGLEANFIVKINSDYTIDETFKVPVSTINSPMGSPVMAYQDDGKVLIGGGFSFLGVNSDHSKLIRILPDGNLDTSFDAQLSKDQNNITNPTVNALAIQSDGKILVGGSRILQNSSVAFVRLTATGEIDDSFQIGSGPALSNGFMPFVSFTRIVDSKIYVIGGFDQFNGQPCRSFVILDMDGKVIGPENIGIQPGFYLQDFDMQSDGKVILLGNFPISGGGSRNIIRLNTDGSFDDAFNLNTTGNINDMEVDGLNNIWIAGNYLNNDQNRILLKFTPDGQLSETSPSIEDFTNETSSLNIGLVKEVPNGVALIGRFETYKGNAVDNFLLVDNNSIQIPLENKLDRETEIYGGEYANDVLNIFGFLGMDENNNVNTMAKVFFTTIGDISSYSVKAASDSTATLSWTGSFQGATEITIEKSTPDDLHYELIETVTPDKQSYQAKQLEEVTPYYFRITGRNGDLSSNSFQDHTTTLIIPEIALSATDVSTTSFTANWKYIEGTDSVQFQLSPDDFTTYVKGYQGLTLKTASKSIVNLKDNQIYQYRIKRFRNGVSSDFSNSIAVNVILGIENQSTQLKVYPNPVNDYLTLNLPDNVNDAKLKLYSMKGELLGENEVPENRPFQIDVRSLPTGLYLLKINFSGNINQVKFIKQ
jgi:uncharacterized delta-60 repeat protein